ncbi:MAG: rod shape-determining protein [Chloroflexota bacterium]|nr:rod shape-determining protein [Chloroflexota bacterium]
MFGTQQIGIDLGTANVLVYVPGRGITINGPSVVAVSTDDNRVETIGDEARQMIGRAPNNIAVVRPMREGVIADYVVTQEMIRHLIRRVCGRVRFFKPDVMVSVPTGITSVERRAVHDAVISAGAGNAYLIEEPLAAALGANVPISSASGSMVVNIGGGTTEVAVLSLNAIVERQSVRVGGNRIDTTIFNYVKRHYNLLIGEGTAEEVKIAIGSALPLDQPMSMEVRGRDQVAGLPRTITITSDEITEAIQETIAIIVKCVRDVLERTPPELASDIIDRGIVMTGGGSLLRNLDGLLTQETGIACYVADSPLICVALGTGVAMQYFDTLKRSLVSFR